MKKEKKKVILEAGMAVMLFLLVVIGGRVCLKAADGSESATGSQAEQKTEQKTEDSGRQLLMIIPTLLAVCIMAFAIIFVLCKKRR